MNQIRSKSERVNKKQKLPKYMIADHFQIILLFIYVLMHIYLIFLLEKPCRYHSKQKRQRLCLQEIYMTIGNIVNKHQNGYIKNILLSYRYKLLG